MMIVTLRLPLAAERKKDAIDILQSVIGPTEVMAGCLWCAMYASCDDENELLLVEEWESRDDLERHLRSDEFRHVLAVMDLAAKPPQLTFHSVAQTNGMAWLEAVCR